MITVNAVSVRDQQVLALMDALTVELAGGGYSAEQTFGYSAEQLERAGVHLVGAHDGGTLVGIAGVEVQRDGVAELKRFFVAPERRGPGVADALIEALFGYAAGQGVTTVRLETGDAQRAAIAFYRRHGFAPVERFEPYVASETSVCMQRLV